MNNTFDPTGTIMIAGERGLAGSAIKRAVQKRWSDMPILETPPSRVLDYRDAAATEAFVQQHKPDYMVIAAARVGGIVDNRDHPAAFIRDNLLIQTNLIHAAYLAGVKKLVFLGSSCIYPKHAPQPMREDMLHTGHLEPTNSAYAMAKLAGIEMCQAYRRQYGCNFISCLPTNLYGQGDTFDKQNSHVIPALLMKFHEAKTTGADEVELWGTGMPLRDFLYSDDLGEAITVLLEHYNDPAPINIGSGSDVSIKELAETIQQVTGFEGQIRFNSDYPDGTPRKSLDISKMASLGWAPSTPLKDGLEQAYDWYNDNIA